MAISINATITVHIHTPNPDLVLNKLDQILENLEDVMTTEAELDTAIQTLGTNVSTLGTALTDALARIQAKLDAAGNPVDLSDELGNVTTAAAAIQAAADTLTGFLPADTSEPTP